MPYTMALKLLLVLTLLTAVLSESPYLLTEKPEWLTFCRRSDPNLNDCMKKGLQTMFPALAKGIPEIDLKPFEPLFIKKIGISKGHGAVSVTGAMEDLLVYGPSNATFTDVFLDFDKGKWEFDISVPYLRLESRYNLKGNILLLPVVGSGDSTVHLRDGKCHVITNIEMKEIQGKEILHVAKMEVDFKVAGMRVHLGNLFNGNKVLGQTVNQFLNKNAIQVIEELKGDIGVALSHVFIEILNNAFSHLPTELWIPKD